MASSGFDLLMLQGNIKRDADSYKDEFLLQLRHYRAVLDIFKLKPGQDSKEFRELVTFMAQVCKSYPVEGAALAGDIITLLDTHAAVLDPGLRLTLVQALILLRNRGQIEPAAVLPLFFRLFRCQDKALRTMLFKHIVTDIKNSNKKHRNEKLNRSVQSFLYSVVADDNEAAAKKSLAVLTELWRRHVWRDARTVNVIASAAFHKSNRVMLAVMKFFLGQDAASGEDGSDVEEGADGRGDDTPKPTAPTKEDIYCATKKGTRSSKKKKAKKLARVQATVKKANRKENAVTGEGFAALHLLHDPQTFAERLFSRLQTCNERFETRLAIMSVISRVVGMHKLLLLNFYPFLQKYIAPHQRDVTAVLAALVQAVHELVPPETLAPVMRQLVDQFVHDKARPEVMTIGLKSVRELCLRCPLVMHEELLQDLTAYRRFRDKAVSSAAKGLIGLFRELNPSMLLKKDRGRGADLAAKPLAYGEAAASGRLQGAELLEAALLAGQGSDEDDFHMDSEDGSGSDFDSGSEASDEDMSGASGSEDEEAGADAGDSGRKSRKRARREGGETADGGASDGAVAGQPQGAGRKLSVREKREAGVAARAAAKKAAAALAAASSRKRKADEIAAGESDDEDEGEGGDEGGSEDGDDEDADASGSDADDELNGSSDDEEEEEGGVEDDEEMATRDASPPPRIQKQTAATDNSLSSLKKQLASARTKQDKRASSVAASEGPASSRGVSVTPGVPIEMDRILTADDFERIKKLRQKALIEGALSKHGLKSAPKAKKQRLLEAAEEEAEEKLALADARTKVGESRLRAEDLMGKHKRRHDKEERLKSIMAGREGRDTFGSSQGRKKKKTGGLSEKQKQKMKAMPIAARLSQLRNRNAKVKALARCPKNFKGHARPHS